MDVREDPGAGDKATRREGPVILAETRLWNVWPMLLGFGYLALIPVLIEMESVQGVSYVLGGSAAGCLLVWLARQIQEPSLRLPALLAWGVDALRRLPSAVLWLPLPLSLSWVAAVMARIRPPAADYNTSFVLWLVALLLFMGIFLIPLAVENGEKLRAHVGAIPWPEVLVVALLTAVAVAVRLIDLADLPSVFSDDEGIDAVRGVGVEQGQRQNFFDMGAGSVQPNLYYSTIALSYKLLGTSVLSARLPTALLGAATVPLLYLMLREMFDRRVALIGAAFVAVFHFHVHYSRIAFNNAGDAFVAVLVLYFAFRAIRTHALLDFAFTGLAAGMAYYFFMGARVVPIVLVLLLAFMIVRTRGRFVLRNFWGLAAALTGALIAFFPAGLAFNEDTVGLYERWETVNIFDSGWLDQQAALTGHSQLHVLWDKFQESFGTLVVYDDVVRHYNAGVPLLDGLTAVLFVIGGVYALLRVFQARFFALFALLGITLTLGAALLVPPVSSNRLLALTPVIAAFVGVGLVVAADAFAHVMPRWRSYMPAAMVIVVALIAFFNLSFYFGTYTPSDRYSGGGRRLNTDVVVEQLGQFDGRYTVYFFGRPNFNSQDPALVFQTRDKVLVGVLEGGVMGSTSTGGLRAGVEEAAAVRASRPNALFLLPVERATEFLRIREICPRGEKSEVYTIPENAVSYVWYEVLDAQACVERVEQAEILKEAG